MDVGFWSALITSVMEAFFKSCGYEKKLENMTWYIQYYFCLDLAVD